jgi:hypothetical protein
MENHIKLATFPKAIAANVSRSCRSTYEYHNSDTTCHLALHMQQSILPTSKTANEQSATATANHAQSEPLSSKYIAVGTHLIGELSQSGGSTRPGEEGFHFLSSRLAGKPDLEIFLT